MKHHRICIVKGLKFKIVGYGGQNAGEVYLGAFNVGWLEIRLVYEQGKYILPVVRIINTKHPFALPSSVRV